MSDNLNLDRLTIKISPEQNGLVPQTDFDLFVPKKLLELVGAPGRVKVKIEETSGKRLRAFVVEETDEPLSDEQSLEKYATGQEMLKIKKERVYPDDVDRLQAEHFSAIKDGIISLNDKVLIFLELRSDSDDQILTVDSYDDREEFRHKGVASEFYDNLESVAKAMGFKAITGKNDETNIDFFLKRGRLPLKLIKPVKHSQILPRNYGFKESYLDLFTVKFLDDSYEVECKL